MTAETGETTSRIYGRMNDRAWSTLLPMLRAGGVLRRDSKTRHFYIDGAGGLTAARVKRLEDAGVLWRVGIDAYALTERCDG